MSAFPLLKTSSEILKNLNNNSCLSDKEKQLNEKYGLEDFFVAAMSTATDLDIVRLNNKFSSKEFTLCDCHLPALEYPPKF